MTSGRRAFGERLRRQRERQHVTLDSIAATTKVAASLFAGLERGDCSRWPGGMYNRSFIRGYAAAVQLDPDETAAEFAELYNPPSGDAAPVPCPPVVKAAPHTECAPLRLIIEEDPVARRWRSVQRAALTIAELAVLVLLAGLIALAAGVNLWITIAMASLGYQVVGRLSGWTSPADGLMAPPRPIVSEPVGQTPEDEAPVTGTASTVA